MELGAGSWELKDESGGRELEKGYEVSDGWQELEELGEWCGMLVKPNKEKSGDSEASERGKSFPFHSSTTTRISTQEMSDIYPSS